MIVTVDDIVTGNIIMDRAIMSSFILSGILFTILWISLAQLAMHKHTQCFFFNMFGPNPLFEQDLAIMR